MTILDLKKDDAVYGGVQYLTGINGKISCEVLKIAKIYLSCNKVTNIRLHDGNGNVFSLNGLKDGAIYPTSVDFTYDENRIKLYVDSEILVKHVAETLGLEYDRAYPYVWKWNKDKAESEKIKLYSECINLADIKMPDGYYATKEECDKANKKTVMVRVSREYHTEVDEDEAQYLLDNPDEYEWKEGDGCISASELM